MKSQKKQKIGRDQVPNAFIPISTCLNEINVDCLEEICKQLNLKDLLSVAGLNRNWNEAAGYAFAKNYGGKMMKIQDIDINRMLKITVTSDCILVRDLKMCLQMLRQFGRWISKLNISYFLVSSKHRAYVDHYVSKYCADWVKEIAFTDGYFKDIKTPFGKATKVYFADCQLGKKFTEFNKFFPKMRNLKFSGRIEVCNPSCIAVHFPHLKHFAMNVNKCGFGQENFAAALKMNPELTSLEMKWVNNVDFFQKNFQSLKHLESLRINNFSKPSNGSVARIHLGSIKKFHILVNCLKFEDIAAIPFTFDALEEFTFNGKINEHLFQFINDNKSLKKLHFQPNMYECTIVEKEMIYDLINSAPAVREIHMDRCYFSHYQVIDIVNKLKFLQKFQFSTHCHSCHFILGNGWRSSIDADSVRLEQQQKE